MREILAGTTGIKMRNDQQLTMVGYADDVITISKNEEDFKSTTSKVIEEAEKM